MYLKKLNLNHLLHKACSLALRLKVCSYVLIFLFALPLSLHAKNSLNGLVLDEKTTSLLILDKNGRLSSSANIALFKNYGYQAHAVPVCASGTEVDCLIKFAKKHKAQSPHNNLLFLTTAPHTSTVLKLYHSDVAPRLFSGVVLFRASTTSQESFPLHKKTDPALLIIAREADDKATIQKARFFADKMRESGVFSWLVIDPEYVPKSLKTSPIVSFIDYFIGSKRVPKALATSYHGSAYWQMPPFTHQEFYKHTDFISTQTVDEKFTKELEHYFVLAPKMLRQWPLKTYQAFDLLAYRDSHPQLKGKRYLTTRNKIGQFLSLDLEKYAPYKPVIVIGIDHETNLFRFNWFFKTKAQYSWLPTEKRPEISVNPLGAFIYFQRDLPTELKIAFSIRSKLNFDALEFVERDPLKALSNYSAQVQEIITYRNHCINCHELDGIGGKAHHIVASSGEKQGGNALPLRSYSRDVLKAFLYDQDRVAKIIGVSPNHVSDLQAKALMKLLNKTD
jgi:hypothetical protein